VPGVGAAGTGRRSASPVAGGALAPGAFDDRATPFE
jgi:hypothetical protein